MFRRIIDSDAFGLSVVFVAIVAWLAFAFANVERRNRDAAELKSLRLAVQTYQGEK